MTSKYRFHKVYTREGQGQVVEMAGPRIIEYLGGEPTLGRLNGDADHRGEFVGIGDRELFLEQLGIDLFVCSSLCRSNNNVLRGLHFQSGLHKLVRCLLGRIVDVIVDLRPDSKTFGRHARYVMEPFDGALYVPDGFAHGVYTVDRGPEYLFKGSIVLYSFSARRQPELEGRIYALDPALNIRWCHPDDPVVMSGSDQRAPMFREYQNQPPFTPCKDKVLTPRDVVEAQKSLLEREPKSIVDLANRVASPTETLADLAHKPLADMTEDERSALSQRLAIDQFRRRQRKP
jgi:dTDP-4-dehydrorhamnose 3,5-epimerase